MTTHHGSPALRRLVALGALCALAACQNMTEREQGTATGAGIGAAIGSNSGNAGKGAAIGAVGGAIGGDAGKGAAIGAASGALIGGMRRRDQERQAAYEQDQWQQQQAAQIGQAQNNFNRAYAVCLEGRGYTVR